MSALRLCRDWKPKLCQSADFFTYGPSKLVEVYDGERHVPALLIGRTLALKIDRAIHSGHAHSELYAEETEKMRNYSDEQAKAEGDIATLDPQIRRLERLVENADLEGGERYLAPLFELQTKRKKIEVTVSDMELSRTRSRELIGKSRDVAERKWRAIGPDFDEIWKKGGFIDKKHLAAPAVQPELVHQAQHHLHMLHNSVSKAKQAFDAHVKKTSGSLTFVGLRLRETLRIAEEDYKKHYEQWLQLGLLKQHLDVVGRESDGEVSGYNQVAEQLPNPPAANLGNTGNAEKAKNNQENDVQNGQRTNTKIHAGKGETAVRKHHDRVQNNPRSYSDYPETPREENARRSNLQDNRQPNDRVQNNHRHNDHQRLPPQQIVRSAKTGVNQPSHLTKNNTDRELRNPPEPQELGMDWSTTRSYTTDEVNVEPLSSPPQIHPIPAFGIPATFGAIAPPAQRDVLPAIHSINAIDNQRPHDAPRTGEKLPPHHSHSQEPSFEPINRSNNATSSAQKRKASGHRETNDEPTHKRQRLPPHDRPSSPHTHRRPSTPSLRERVLERRDSRPPGSSDRPRFPSRTQESRTPDPDSPFKYSYRRKDRNGTREASSQPGPTSQHQATARGQHIQQETTADRQQRNPLSTLPEDDEPTTAQGHLVGKKTPVERQQRKSSRALPGDVERGLAQGKRAEKYTHVSKNTSVERRQRNRSRTLSEDDDDML